MFQELLRRMPDWELVDPRRAEDHAGDLRPLVRPRPHPLHTKPVIALSKPNSEPG